MSPRPQSKYIPHGHILSLSHLSRLELIRYDDADILVGGGRCHLLAVFEAARLATDRGKAANEYNQLAWQATICFVKFI